MVSERQNILDYDIKEFQTTVENWRIYEYHLKELRDAVGALKCHQLFKDGWTPNDNT